ncbi:hypothetical protein GGI42DRAFT_333817 [Trichoderma sp. SZMC 28013]
MLALFRPSPLLRSMSSGIASPKLGPGSGWLAGPNEAAQASRWMRLTWICVSGFVPLRSGLAKSQV